MKIKSVHLDVLYEAQPDCKTIDVSIEQHSQRFAVLHGGLRMISMILPDEFVGRDLDVSVKSDGQLVIGSITSRSITHGPLGIQHDPRGIEECLQNASSAPVSLQWFATWKCNYKCNYCWQETVRDSYRKEKPAKKAPHEWAEALLRLNPSEVYISGGEPSTLPNFTKIVEAVGSRVPVNITSNLGNSFDIDTWEKEVSPEAIDCVTFSFHPTQQSFDEYSRKLRHFVSVYGASKAGSELVMHPGQTQHEQPLRDLASELDLRTLNIDVFHQQPTLYPPVSGNCADKTPLYDSKLTTLPRHAPGDTSPHYCIAGVTRLNIDPVGDAYTCMSAIDRSKMFGKHSLPHYSPVGNVFDEGFRMQREPVMCWETFRCSGCDVAKVKDSWVQHPHTHELPLPQ